MRTKFDVYVSIIYLPIDIPFGNLISSSTIMILSVPSIRQRSILGCLPQSAKNNHLYSKYSETDVVYNND